MRSFRSVFSFVAVMAIASSALAGPPVAGLYLSDDLGGQMFSGRFSESWVGAGSAGQIGNTLNAQSYTMAMGLGTQWTMSCPSIAAPPTLISDTRDINGTGDLVYQTMYSGGTFFLSQTGPWGDEDYTGFVTLTDVTTTYLFVFGELIGIRSNVTLHGQFDDFADCLEFAISNAAFMGDTDTDGPKPADFPEFLDANCNSGVLSRGGWGSVTDVALRIVGDCTVPTEDKTWGGIKALYDE